MNTLAIPRPASDEAPEHFQGYIAEVAGDNIADQLAGQGSEVEGLFASIDDKAALARYAPGKWSIKEVLGHLTDAERIFGYRLLRISRGDRTPLPGFDEDAYVPAARFDARPLRSLMDEFRAVRQATLALVRGVPPECWGERGEANGAVISARALAYILVGHVTHHLDVLRDRYPGRSAQGSSLIEPAAPLVSLDSFSTARLDAERLAVDHWDDLRRMDEDPRFMMELGGVRDAVGTLAYLERNLAHWAAHGFGLWVLRDRDTGGVVGRAVLRHLEVDGVDEVETGYGLLPEFWGRGFATEIARACVNIGRERLGLASVIGITLPTNAASQHVMLKAGLQYERDIVHTGLPHLLFRTVYSSYSSEP
jgi:RimJ/RimL family protein N-acetyltransferase